MMTTTGPHKVADKTGVGKTVVEGTTRIDPRGFNITWGNDDRYWNIIKSNMSDESGWMAELKQVSWLEVTCITDNVKVGKTYRVGFKVSMRPDAFGWDGIDVYVMVKVGMQGKFKAMKVSLGNIEPNSKAITIPGREQPLEIEVDPSTPTESKTIHLGLYEVWSSKWKGGMQIHEAVIEEK